MAQVRGLPITRRFHAKPGKHAWPMRYWEHAIYNGLCSKHPEARLWANVLADAFYTIYRSRSKNAVKETVAWVLSNAQGSLTFFVDLAEIFDIEPIDVRRDLLNDIKAGRLKLKVNHADKEQPRK